MSKGGHPRRAHEEEPEEHENHERWLVSYADMMTLLMVLFIVLFAISQVDQKKFAALKEGLSAGFGAPVEMLPGADSLLDPGGAIAPDSVNLAGDVAAQAKTSNLNPQAPVNPSKVEKIATVSTSPGLTKEVKSLKKAESDLKKALRKAGVLKSASFRFDERGLVVSVVTDNVLFQSGSAGLEPQGRKILNTIAPTLVGLPNHLSIDGHTNSIPIKTSQFPSNWELSSARATGVLRYLHSTDGVPYYRMSATAFADTQPRLPKSDPRSVDVNRRVEIVVLAKVDNSVGRAVASLGNNSKG